MEGGKTPREALNAQAPCFCLLFALFFSRRWRNKVVLQSVSVPFMKKHGEVPVASPSESSMTLLISPKGRGCFLVERKNATHRTFQEAPGL
jgi:hypothetical protein